MDEAKVIVMEAALAFSEPVCGGIRPAVQALGLEDAPDAVAVEVRQEMADDEGEVIEREVGGTPQAADDLDARGVRIVITTLGVDSSTPADRMVFGVLAQLAEFERATLIVRTNAGLAAAKKGSIRKSGVLASEWAAERSMAEVPVIYHPGHPRLLDAPLSVKRTPALPGASRPARARPPRDTMPCPCW